jgi:phage major head subunit gpT-like protein
MSINQKVTVFTSKIRSTFYKSYSEVATPAPWQKITEVLSSEARIEHFNWMNPTPAISLYTGSRDYGQIGSLIYSTENREFASGFKVLLRDVEDDKTGGYQVKPKELSAKARNFPGLWSIMHLANGESLPCFDGTSYFANSHTIGEGDNLLPTVTATGNSDGRTYKLAALYTGDVVKPLMWQDRKAPKFMTNAGTPQSSEEKEIRYWLDMEGQSLFGYWWNAVLIKFTNLPSVQELHTAFTSIENAFRTFAKQTSLAADFREYAHEQTEFTQSNLCLVGSTGLRVPLATALGESWSPVSPVAGSHSNSVAATNHFKGWADFFVTRRFDDDVTVSTVGH